MEMDFSDDEDFIVSKKKAVEKQKKERRSEKPDKRRSTEEPPESSKKSKRGKSVTPKKDASKGKIVVEEEIIKLNDSDESNQSGFEAETSTPPPLKESNSITSAATTAPVASPIRDKVQTKDDDRDSGAEEKESMGFVSAATVLDNDDEDDAYAPPSQNSDGDENDIGTKTPKSVASSKGKSTGAVKADSTFKVVPQVSARLKSLSKWTPPGPVGSTRSPSVGTTPSSGLRMGLSRNSRPKPLHQPPKVV